MEIGALRGVQIVRGLEALGISPAALSGAQEFLATFARNPGARVEMAEFVELIAQIEARTGDPLVLLRAALATPVLGFLSNLIQPQPTLRDALEAVGRLAPLAGEDRHLGIEEGGERTWVCSDNGFRDDPERAISYELAIALLLLELRPLCEKPLPILEIWFLHAPRGPVDEYERLLEAPVRFRQVRCAFAIPSAALGWRPRRADPELGRLLEAEGWHRLTTAHPSRFASKVAGALREKVGRPGNSTHAADLSERIVARQLGVSVRTLQRNLREEATTFRTVLDRLRRDRALELLMDPTLELATVAERLGFGNVSTFARAYRRWTGRSPGSTGGGRRPAARASTSCKDRRIRS